jgi:hypothetical protein
LLGCNGKVGGAGKGSAVAVNGHRNVVAAGDSVMPSTISPVSDIPG